MARPVKVRRICSEPIYNSFAPVGIHSENPICLSVVEYEIIRLIDHENLRQEQAAIQMGVARTTVTDIYNSARKKVAEALVQGRQLIISGGKYRFCDGQNAPFCRKKCAKCVSQNMPEAKGEQTMRIAVTYEDGMIFQHFGHSQSFKIYDIEDGKVVNSTVVGTDGQGHGALAGFLHSGKVDVLICGGIGGGAQMALAEAGIKLYGGVSGNADEAVQDLIEGTLRYNPEVRCSHHDENHGENHECGSHGCGSHGCHS